MGMKGRIRSGIESNQISKLKSEMNIGRVNSLNIQTGNNLVKSQSNVNNGNYQSTKNARNSTKNIFSTKTSNNNSELVGSLDLKTEISNRFSTKEKQIKGIYCSTI